MNADIPGTRRNTAGAPSKPNVIGAPQDAAKVREMFGRIAPRYDFLNRLLSMNIDVLWRAAVVREFADILKHPDARVLDLACGTGDLSLALQAAGPARIIGSDFCHPMITRAHKRFAGKIAPLEADALNLPFADSSFDLITISFGFRNLSDYDAGLREMRRLLRPGGRVGILDFSEVQGPIGPLFRFYFKNVLPAIGGAISGDAAAYKYLPTSVARFPSPEELADRMTAAGLSRAAFKRLSFGIACLHTATLAS